MRSECAQYSGAIMATKNFNIDDAFESDDEDPIRVYGATTESAPLRAKRYVTRLEDQAEDHKNETENTDYKQGLLPGAKDRQASRTDSTHSFGSESDTYSVTTKTFQERRWWKHPKVRENWKIVLASFALLVIGIALFVAGVAIEISHTTAVQSFVFFIAGAICLIPGGYHVVYIYCAVKGKRGFSFYNLPVFK